MSIQRQLMHLTLLFPYPLLALGCRSRIQPAGDSPQRNSLFCCWASRDNRKTRHRWWLTVKTSLESTLANIEHQTKFRIQSWGQLTTFAYCKLPLASARISLFCIWVQPWNMRQNGPHHLLLRQEQTHLNTDTSWDWPWFASLCICNTERAKFTVLRLAMWSMTPLELAFKRRIFLVCWPMLKNDRPNSDKQYQRSYHWGGFLDSSRISTLSQYGNRTNGHQFLVTSQLTVTAHKHTTRLPPIPPSDTASGLVPD